MKDEVGTKKVLEIALQRLLSATEAIEEGPNEYPRIKELTTSARQVRCALVKRNLRSTMRVQCGDLDWRGRARSLDEAIIRAMRKSPPENMSSFVRVHDGRLWRYLDSTVALKIAGYVVRQTVDGLEVRGPNDDTD